jgi:hypothetical protein
MADYNKLPIVNIIFFTYRHLDHLDVEIIVKLCTPQAVLLMRVVQYRQRNAVSHKTGSEEISAQNLRDPEDEMPVGQLNKPVLSKTSISSSE